MALPTRPFPSRGNLACRNRKSARCAALLHDIGKLSVPNSILEKPAKPTEDEWAVIKKHPYYTHEILSRLPGFTELGDVAAAHHERLDGRGYWRNWDAEQLNTPARILAVADVFDALHARRPYRDSLPVETVFSMLEKDAPRALDGEFVEALEASSRESTSSLINLAERVGESQPVDQPVASQSR